MGEAFALVKAALVALFLAQWDGDQRGVCEKGQKVWLSLEQSDPVGLEVAAISVFKRVNELLADTVVGEEGARRLKRQHLIPANVANTRVCFSPKRSAATCASGLYKHNFGLTGVAEVVTTFPHALPAGNAIARIEQIEYKS